MDLPGIADPEVFLMVLWDFARSEARRLFMRKHGRFPRSKDFTEIRWVTDALLKKWSEKIVLSVL